MKWLPNLKRHILLNNVLTSALKTRKMIFKINTELTHMNERKTTFIAPCSQRILSILSLFCSFDALLDLSVCDNTKHPSFCSRLILFVFLNFFYRFGCFSTFAFCLYWLLRAHWNEVGIKKRRKKKRTILLLDKIKIIATSCNASHNMSRTVIEHSL